MRIDKRTGKTEYQPAYQGDLEESIATYLEDLKEYYDGYRSFEEGKEFEYDGVRYGKKYFGKYSDYAGDPPSPPDPKYFMPKGEWYQLYQNVSEGTPLSPPFEKPEELVDWLANNEDYWGTQWTREGAESMLNDGFALSGVFAGGKFYPPEEQHLLKN